MKKEVSIVIKGSQLESEEEPVVSKASGTYHLHGDRHYLQYEEKPEQGEGIIKSRIKIELTKIELSKKGANCSQMTFDLMEETIAIYQTPFGNLAFEVNTSEISMEETADMIQVKLKYSLSSNASLVSNNQIIIMVEPII